jgi:phosphoglycerate dehydrogenase-like enzyme
MNRRHFLTSSTAAAGLIAASVAPAQASSADRITVLIPPMPPDALADLKAAAPSANLITCRDDAQAIDHATDATGCYGFISPRMIRAGKALRWAQQPSAGVEHLMEIPELVKSDITLTNMQRVYAPEIADQAMAYLLAFTRDLGHYIRAQSGQEWPRRRPDFVLDELSDKTMLVIGLGGIGSEIARRAWAFGMRVIATDPKVLDRPPTVDELRKPDAFHELLPRADVVACAAPLTKQTRRMIGPSEFAMMKPGVILINVARGGLVDTDALVAALDSKHVAAAGLDVTDPEPLTSGHALWSRNVIITPHTAGQSPAGERRRHQLFRENLRRFVAGEMLLNAVDKKVGY